MKSVIYSRVSNKSNQSTTRQINELQEVEGFEIVKTYTESISGFTKSVHERPALQDALRYIYDNNIECLMIHEISRIGRRTEEVLGLLRELKENGVKVYIKSLGLTVNDDDNQSEIVSKLLITIMSDIARMESEMLSYRIISGLNERKRRGLKIGRQFNTNETLDKFLNKPINKKIAKYLKRGESIRWRLSTKLCKRGFVTSFY
jgi:DNA invertase Pin-like site-specific DNA recombinase